MLKPKPCRVARRRPAIVVGLVLGLLAIASPSWAARTKVLDWADPAWDDHGPGGYVYPSDSVLYKRGSFDLRRFVVEVEGDTVYFSVTFAEHIRAPAITKRTNASTYRLDNEIYVQNVDIYIDTDPTTGIGETDSVPGRNVTIEPDHAWDVAVVMTPQPFAARSMLDDWTPGRKVLFPANLRSSGPTVTARIPMHELGGLPKKFWGYQVLVTGATWDQSFDVVNRFALGQGKNAFTMPVTTVPEPEKFGGGELAFFHPYVVDMIAPVGATQEKILSAHDAEAKHRAIVPLIYAHPEAFLAERKRRQASMAALPEVPTVEKEEAFVELRVKDIQGELVILDRSQDTPIEQYRIGTVFDPGGNPVARLVVTSVYPGFVVTTAVEGKANVKTGAVVRFDKKPSP